MVIIGVGLGKSVCSGGYKGMLRTTSCCSGYRNRLRQPICCYGYRCRLMTSKLIVVATEVG